MCIVPNGADHVEVGALVLPDVGCVVAEQIPSPFTDQAEEGRVAERATINGTADLGSKHHSLPPDVIGIVARSMTKDGRDRVAGSHQLPDEPVPGEGTPAREEDLHALAARSGREMPGRVEVALVGILVGKHDGCDGPAEVEPGDHSSGHRARNPGRRTHRRSRMPRYHRPA